VSAHLVWASLSNLCAFIFMFWAALAGAGFLFRHDGCRHIAAEIHPFVLPAILLGNAANVATSGHLFNPELTLGTGIALCAWWVWREDDDDRWKRRRRRIAARIRQVASGRLVVEPART
jgi:hypothetical protein